jgi:hypothetical protein
MRAFMTIVESMIPRVDRNAIIQHMISSVMSHKYWDTDARDPDGNPMSSNDAYDMSSTWAEFHDGDFDIDGAYFKQFVAKWAEERFDEVVGWLNDIPLDNGCYRIHRVIRVPHGWKPKNGLGVYWTYDVQGAEIDTPWGHKRDGHDHWLHGLVEPQHVDWAGTILAGMDWMSGGRELELRVKKGAPIKLLEILDDQLNRIEWLGGEVYTA